MGKMFLRNLHAFAWICLSLVLGWGAANVSFGRAFTNPIVPAPSADPFIVQQDGFYYHIHNMRSQRRNAIAIRKTTDVTQLGDTRPQCVWIAPETGPYSKEIWAPELHFYQGKWYIYVAADDGKNVNHRMWVIESEGKDPMGPYNQTPTLLETGGWAIDGTVLQDKDRLWFIWSGWPEQTNGTQYLYIAPMESPTRISAERTLLSVPDQPWERKAMPLLEGPQILRHQDKLFIIYSASGSWTKDYCLGMLEYTGGDFTDPKSWKKHSSAPVFASKDSVLGVGHCSFFLSPDGQENWIAYHTKSKPENGWGDRRVQIQPFPYDAQGVPVFGQPVQPGVELTVPSSTDQAQQQPTVRDNFSDTWVATDNLGRSLPDFQEVGGPRTNRSIGMFYFLWNGAHGMDGPYDVSKILTKYPEAIWDAKHPAWGKMYVPHHWGESWFGYYTSTDEAVYEKHARMLGEMGVDVIIFDASNKVTYFDQYMALCRAFIRVRQSGGCTPQIAFLCPFWDPATTITKLWNEFYSKNLYPELWYRWEGKPLIMADPAACGNGISYGNRETPEALNPGETLGQSFRQDKPFASIAASIPTWNSTNSAATLTLKKDSPTGELVMQERFTIIADNGWLTLQRAEPLPAGTYYLELSQPEKTLGWWSENKNPIPGGKAWKNGKEVAGSRNLRITEASLSAISIGNFFTFRKPQPDYFTGPTGPNQWGWLEVYPQHIFYDANNHPEQMTVGVAQNATDGHLSVLSNPRSHGRSFHNGQEPSRDNQDTTGRNFQEQWNRALQVDPPFLFITGWNEWIMGRFDEHASFYGVGPVSFVDQFNNEYSRDIEPANCPHQDNYYYQTIANIRRYKGVREAQKVVSHHIQLDGTFADWKAIRPEFRDDIGDPIHRKWHGVGTNITYINQTGRNDIISAKVSLSKDILFTYVRTLEPMGNPARPHWMLLLLDVDQNHRNGYGRFGYDFIVRSAPENPLHKAIVQRYIRKPFYFDVFEFGEWETVATVDRQINGTQMEMAIPLNLLGVEKESLSYIDFKWADNIQETEEAKDFTIHGDVAPNDRYNYRAIFK